jgi:hypothetical protein
MQNDVGKNYYKQAFFSAFTTISSFCEPAVFFDDDIAPIFSNYKDALRYMQEKSGNTEPEDEVIYTPVPYCLFGDFDLAVFSLIDDFGFATKEFKPSSSSGGFKYQINAGIIPLIKTYKDDQRILTKFKEEMLPRFFSGKDFYPFTGIALIKLNSAMLIGMGDDFLKFINFFLTSFIDKFIEKKSDQGYQFFYIINETLGWNELTINFFGNSMSQMQEVLLRLRNFRLLDIIDFIRELKEDTGANDEYIDSMLDISSLISTESLLADFIEAEKKESLDYRQSHPIIATSITFGYHASLTKMTGDFALEINARVKEEHREMLKTECDLEAIHIGWKVKPGHERAALDLIARSMEEGIVENIDFDQVQTGKYPFVFPLKPISFMKYLRFAQRADRETRIQMHLNIIKFRSRIQWVSSIKYNDFNSKGHYDYALDRFQIPKQVIDDLQNRLRVYPVSHTIKGQVENLIINFNDAISDPFMYSYFMGLKRSLISFLKENFIIGREKEGEKAPPTTFREVGTSAKDQFMGNKKQDEDRVIKPVETTNITHFVQAWNKAYWNRYFHSYYFTEINDFNIEHHGGIQQILFTYDTMYKLVTKRIYGEHSKSPFVNVQVWPGITSTQFYNSVNFNHLFRPAIYACECVHEAANHIIPYLVYLQNRPEYTFLLNPRSDIVEPDMLKDLDIFEQNMRLNMQARDDYENDYFNNNFGINTIRQIVTDYITYRLSYEKPEENNINEIPFVENKEAAIRFYHSHWYLFLMKTELYGRETKGNGAWFFREEEFKVLFIRFNLMFFLFYNCEKEALNELNDECPSIELKPVWEGQKKALIDFVIRLGCALKKEFNRRIGGEESFVVFHNDIKKIVIEGGWQKLNEKEKKAYNEMIKINFGLIKTFHGLFADSAPDKYNIIIRKSTSYKEEGAKNPRTNIDFFKQGDTRNIFLDPKGNLFSNSPLKRQSIFSENVEYIKLIWDQSMKIAREAYLEEVKGETIV